MYSVLSAPAHKTFDIANLVTLLQYCLFKSAQILTYTRISLQADAM